MDEQDFSLCSQAAVQENHHEITCLFFLGENVPIFHDMLSLPFIIAEIFV